MRTIAISAAVILLCGVCLWMAVPQPPLTGQPALLSGGANDPWRERPEYKQGDETLFRIYPDPNLAAGKPFGYLFNFQAPFSVFAGKELTITAQHKETGMKLTALGPRTITEPSPGYPGLQRFGVNFGLPLGGLWRFEVDLDGRFYGDAVLPVAEPSWEVSPEFVSGTYTMRGISKKVGFIDAGFTAGKPNKYMWHFWGTEEELDGPFAVKAVKQGSTDIIDVFTVDALAGELNGADRHAPSTMVLPSPGRWLLMAYVGDRLFGAVVVEVK
ncbi:DUF4871 domain-containing protein [Paenibacillus sp. P26]|nr:DUF4871 domain-containing protein [Paenibacillus sp. P26]